MDGVSREGDGEMDGMGMRRASVEDGVVVFRKRGMDGLCTALGLAFQWWMDLMDAASDLRRAPGLGTRCQRRAQAGTGSSGRGHGGHGVSTGGDAMAGKHGKEGA